MSIEDVNEQLARREAHGVITQSDLEAATLGLYDDRGSFNASGNAFPSTGGSGNSGAILKGDVWTISTAGTLGTRNVQPGDTVRATIDTPGQTAGNWSVTAATRYVYSPDVPYAVPSAEDNEFNAGALDPKWTAFGASVSPTFVIPSHLRVAANNVGVNGSAIVQDVADANGIWRMKLRPPRSAASGNPTFGFCCKLVGSNAARAYQVDVQTGNVASYSYGDYPNFASIAGTSNVGAAFQVAGKQAPIYIELEYVASSKLFSFRVSNDGVRFQQLDATAELAGLDKIGIHANGSGGTTADIDWFRKLQGLYTGQ